jgi:phage-related protein
MLSKEKEQQIRQNLISKGYCFIFIYENDKIYRNKHTNESWQP